MDAMKCFSCNKKLLKNMDIEYSEEINAYFCCPECAIDHYFEYMRSTPFLVYEKTEEEIKSRGVRIIGDSLYLDNR